MAQGGMEDHTRGGQVEPGIFCKGSKMQFEKLALTTVQTGWERGELQNFKIGPAEPAITVTAPMSTSKPKVLYGYPGHIPQKPLVFPSVDCLPVTHLLKLCLVYPPGWQL